jgi:threonine synthase
VNGLISDCARIVAERKEQEGWFDFSTLKEPYRVEGKKTMAYELFEQLSHHLGRKLPDAVIFPSGGGVGIIGMWKAFEEMEQLGWLDAPDAKGKRPRMVAVQAEGCAPIVKAWSEGKQTVEIWRDASTIAAGLRVPRPYGDYLVLDILKRSSGTAVAVSDSEIQDAFHHWARTEGIFAAPEGAASLAAYRKLRSSGVLSEKDRVILFNTGTGLKYLDVLNQRKIPPLRHIGGIIGPY